MPSTDSRNFSAKTDNYYKKYRLLLNTVFCKFPLSTVCADNELHFVSNSSVLKEKKYKIHILTDGYCAVHCYSRKLSFTSSSFCCIMWQGLFQVPCKGLKIGIRYLHVATINKDNHIIVQSLEAELSVQSRVFFQFFFKTAFSYLEKAA